MGDTNRGFELRNLRETTTFVRRLARRLVRDEATAEDLAQDAWVAALKRPPTGTGLSVLEDDGSLRGWFARVLRNQASLRLRRGERRVRRESDAARAEELPSTHELVERTELHGRLVQATLALPEAYRDVLLRRFWSEETAAEIATNLGIPERTVRTRLRRGLGRLREKLRAGCEPSAKALVCMLSKLTGDPPPSVVATPVASPASPASPAFAGTSLASAMLSVFLMKKAIAAVLAVSLCVLFYLQREPGELALAQRAPEVVSAVSLGDQEPLEPAVAAGEAELPSIEREALRATKDKPTATAPTPPEPIDHDARDWLTFRVEDANGNPITRAEIKMSQLRPKVNNGSSYGWYLEDSEATTDTAGEARMWYPRYVVDSNDGHLETGGVGFTVTHPEYTTYTDYDHRVKEPLVRITLAQGALVIVSGWIDDPNENITELEVTLDDAVRLRKSDWLPLSDGRPSCAKVPPGKHAMHVRHEGPDGPWFSEIERFELIEGEPLELHVKLHRARTFRGQLAPEVPRPIENGELWLNLYARDDAKRIVFRLFKATIEPGGSFEFSDLPPGNGELIGLCDGWAVLPNRVAGPDGTVEAELHQIHFEPEPNLSQPYIVPMEPTATAVLTVLDPDGAPLPGAKVSSWPNVHWSVGYSMIYLERRWVATTDRFGQAVLENLPPDPRLGFAATHTGLRMDDKEERRLSRNAIESGETLELEIRLIAREE